MASASRGEPWGLGKYILQYRAPIGLVLIAITAFMGYWAANVRIATSFENFFPAGHQNTELYRKFKNQYGGAQSLYVMLRVKSGDIFNFATLKKIQDITREVDVLPGVDHNEVFSLASYRVAFQRAVPGALISIEFMYPNVPTTQAQLDELRRNVMTHREPVAGYITFDNKGAMVTAASTSRRSTTRRCSTRSRRSCTRYSDENTEIFVAGEPVISGWGYNYLREIKVIFAIAVALMLIILYLSIGERSSWWAPILTGTFSAIWGLGFVSVMGYNFDPVMLVIPFILTARDLSHGIQWQGRYYDELDRLDDKLLACATTTDVMLPPGLLSILADIAGIIFISFGGIPVLKEIGFGGAMWLAGSLTMVFVFQPIFMSYLPRPRIRERSWLSRTGTGNRRWRVPSIRGLAGEGAGDARLHAVGVSGGGRDFYPVRGGLGAACADRLSDAGDAALSAGLEGQPGYRGNRQIFSDRHRLDCVVGGGLPGPAIEHRSRGHADDR